MIGIPMPQAVLCTVYNPALVSLLARYLTGDLYLFLTWASNQSTHVNQIIDLEGCTQKWTVFEDVVRKGKVRSLCIS